MKKTRLIKLFSAIGVVTTPIVVAVSCSGNEEFFKNSLTEETKSQWMKDIDLEKRTFTLDLSSFTQLKSIRVTKVNLAAFPFTHVVKTGEGDNAESTIYLLSVNKIIFPSNLEEIGPRTFHGGALETHITELVFAPDSKLKTIGEFAFLNQKIKSLTLPNSVENIGKQSFAFNEIETLVYNPTKGTIAEEAFWGNKIANKPTFSSEVKQGKNIF
ncbi:leucine-rich repeat domain-containing protein [Mycoplasma iguanae]|uniref:Leucine-rich repeat domain-containing protein n=1 Tax=Mycoplasma iguanae TaxID=292461 RepID=A0ABY5R8H9_9MOLU|nr:leucine-rich repeat domain-containing protein [Mycoplasma iguanae]UVD81586.1 leucine-rich repeat domain-containing protein [Mycoplasma iguanae]